VQHCNPLSEKLCVNRILNLVYILSDFWAPPPDAESHWLISGRLSASGDPANTQSGSKGYKPFALLYPACPRAGNLLRGLCPKGQSHAPAGSKVYKTFALPKTRSRTHVCTGMPLQSVAQYSEFIFENMIE
jgi:hypothetical protein